MKPLRDLPGKFRHYLKGHGFYISIPKGNRVDALALRASSGSIRMSAHSTGNIVRIGPDGRVDAKITIDGCDNRVLVGARARLNCLIGIKGDGHTISIGDDCVALSLHCSLKERCDIQIGSGLLASKGVYIQTTDAHSIIDLETGKRTNFGGSVSIGEHVWIGRNVTIGKSVTLPNDCIVAAHSFVSRSFHEEHILIGGVPAKILKRGVTWDKRLRPRPDDELPACVGDRRRAPDSCG